MKNKQIVFYVSPVASHNDSSFFMGAVRNKLLPLARAWSLIGCDVTFWIPDFLAQQISFPSNIKTHVISSQEFIKKVEVFSDLEFQLYDKNADVLKNSSDFYKNTIGVSNDPDLIVCWESNTEHLKLAFPDSQILHLMPGFLSRLPYPDLIYFDTAGLFKRSSIYNLDKNLLDNIPVAPNDIKYINELSNDLQKFFIKQVSVEDMLQNIPNYSNFGRYALIPLQVSEHFAYRVDSEFKSQNEVIEYVLNSAPKDTGCIFTQYVTKNINEQVINTKNSEYLQFAKNNFIYSDSFNSVDNISQYLLGYVDEVITFSSSIALQGLLLNKKVTIIGNSFLSTLIEYSNESFENRIRAIIYLLFYNGILFSHLLNTEIASKFLNKILSKEPFDIRELDIDYLDTFKSSFKYIRAEEKLDESIGQSFSSYGSLVSKLKPEIEKYDVISFDVFDTLIERPFAQPTDLFLLVERRLKLNDSLPFFHFANARIKAEQIAKEISEEEEITLEDIYAILQLQFNLTDIQTNQIKELELELEYSLLSVRPAGKALYDECVKKNKRIIFISDMYLSTDFIKSTLLKNGYTVDGNLYVSSDIKLKKKTGSLFGYVFESENISSDQQFHIGDNNFGDFKVPTSLGIKSFRLVRSIDKMANHQEYSRIFKHIKGVYTRSINESAVIYMVARKFFDNPMNIMNNNTVFNGSARSLGYALLGPCVVDFSLWINKEAQDNKFDHLFFMARDGRIVKSVYDTLFADRNIKTSYMYGSRALMRNTSIPSLGDIYANLGSLLNKIPSEILNEKFNWDVNNQDLNKLVETLQDELNAFSQIKEEYSNLIMQSSAKQELFLDYCNEIGIMNAHKPCMIDIGYAGTLQYFLQKNINKNLNGLYYVLFNTSLKYKSENCSMKGYVGNNIANKNHYHPLSNNGFLYETLFCSDEDTIIDVYRDTKGIIHAIRDTNELDFIRKGVIKKIHKGVEEFAYDFNMLLNPIFDLLYPEPEHSTNFFQYFIQNPGGKDAEIFEGVIFMSNFAESKFRYLVPPRNLAIDYKNKKVLSVWPQGADVFIRRPDVLPKKKPVKKAVDTSSSIDISSQSKLLKVEKFLVGYFLKKNPKKLAKYEKDPVKFFKDSRSKYVQIYISYIR